MLPSPLAALFSVDHFSATHVSRNRTNSSFFFLRVQLPVQPVVFKVQIAARMLSRLCAKSAAPPIRA